MTDLLQPAFDREKFKDVVHFICDNCNIHELGNVKLHKILYFSDMLCFLSTGNPMTGAEYQKQQFGPAARHLSATIDQLIRDNRLRVEKRNYFGFTKVDYISIQQPSRLRLGSNEEVQILREVIDFVCARSAKEISELSHNEAWHAAELGETIPYYSAFGMVPSGISIQDMEAAIEEARKIRPVINAQFQAR